MENDEEVIREAIKKKAVYTKSTKTIIVITNPAKSQARDHAIGKIYSELLSEGCLDAESSVEDSEYRKTFVLLTPFPDAIPNCSWTIVKSFMGSKEKVMRSRMTMIQKTVIEHAFVGLPNVIIPSYGVSGLSWRIEEGLAEIKEKGSKYILHQPQNLLEAFLIGEVFRYITGEPSYHSESRAFMIRKVKTDETEK